MQTQFRVKVSENFNYYFDFKRLEVVMWSRLSYFRPINAL